MVANFLRSVHPFRHLSPADIEALVPQLTSITLQPGEVLYEPGDDDRRVFLLERGRLEVRNMDREVPMVIEIIDAGHYFGDRPALFDERRRHQVRALEQVVCWSMSGKAFLDLVQRSPSFARALGDVLRGKQKLFAAFDQFVAQLTLGAGAGEIQLSALLEAYRTLEPALHPLLASQEIDFGALLYAIRRLPANATRTFVYFLTDELPLVWNSPARAFHEVSSGVRPRSVYEVMPGKSMVLLRDTTTDLVDLVTCLCVLAIEARKIRKRFRDPGVFLALVEHVARRESSRGDRSSRRRALARASAHR